MTEQLDNNFEEWIYSIINEFNNIDIGCWKQDKLVLPCYVASFSTQEDNLSLWNYYTKNQQHVGYSFKVDTNNLLKNLSSQTLNINYSFTNGKVIYSKDEQLNLLKNLLNDYNPLYKNIKMEIGISKKKFYFLKLLICLIYIIYFFNHLLMK